VRARRARGRRTGTLAFALPPLLGRGLGSSDWSGATSSSMASKTDETWSLTSPSCIGSRSRSMPQASRCERENVERLDGAQGVRVALVRLVEQAVALGRVVRHPDSVRRISPSCSCRVAAAVPLHQPTCLAQAVGRLVEVGHAALVVAVGQVVELEILYARFRPYSESRAGRPSSPRPLRRRPPRPPRHLSRRPRGPWSAGTSAQLAQTGGPVRTPGPGGSLLRYGRFWRLAPLQHGLERGDQLARWTTLTSGSSTGLGSSPRPVAKANRRPCSVCSAAAGAGAGPSDCSAAVPRSDCSSSRAWAKAFARGAPIRSRSLAAPPLAS